MEFRRPRRPSPAAERLLVEQILGGRGHLDRLGRLGVVVTEQMEKSVEDEQAQLCHRIGPHRFSLVGCGSHRDRNVAQEPRLCQRNLEYLALGLRRKGQDIGGVIRARELAIETADLTGSGQPTAQRRLTQAETSQSSQKSGVKSGCLDQPAISLGETPGQQEADDSRVDRRGLGG